MAGPRLTSRQMCEHFDVTPRTLRHYEYIELLQPEVVGRRRYFGPRELARMTLIRRARRFGFPLEEIRQWLDLYHTVGPRAQLESAMEKLGVQAEQLQEERDRLDARLREIHELRQLISDDLARDN